MSFRITERVVTKRLPCRNFGLRYLKAYRAPGAQSARVPRRAFVDLAHRARAKTVPAELLADRPSVVSKCASPTVAWKLPLTPTCLEQPHELAYSIEHELHGERRKQNAEHTCDDVQSARAQQPHQSLSAEADHEAREQKDER